ncbi:MAG: HEAT repeat domain-containing protein [Anaerolineales bacterium]|jgi:HEAT repeat protein
MLEQEFSSQDEISGISFDSIIDALLDSSNPFPAKYLYRLSDLGGEELSQFIKIWPNIETQRRLRLIEDLEVLVESNFLVSFESIFKLGLSDPQSEIRLVSIRALWECEDTTLIPKFIHILKTDNSLPTRAQAASGLGHFVLLGEIGKLQKKLYSIIVDTLLEVVEDKSLSQIGQYALESLGFSSHPKIPQLIEEAYDSGDEDWLASSLVAMGRTDDEQWHPMVVDNLDHHDLKVRLMATQAAGKLAIPDSIPLLLHLLSDEDDEIQMASVWSLSEIGGGDVRETLENLLEDTEDEEALELIENALENLIFNEDLQDFNLMDFSQDDSL